MLKWLQDKGLKANKEKCDFFRDRVQFFWHEIDREGLNKTQRIEAVVSAPRAVNVSQLHSFLGLVNYYNRFLPNVSIVLHPLHQLLGESREWQWSERCELAFTEAKGMITSEQVLMRYDPALPVRLACDASPTGIGAVLSPVNPCGSERPVAFASWSLTKTEHKYAQIDEEALSMMWGGGGNGSMFFPLWEAVYAHYKPLPLAAIFHPEKGVPGIFLLWNHDFFYKEKYVCLVPVFNSSILQDLWQYYILKKVWHILFFLRLSFTSLQPG